MRTIAVIILIFHLYSGFTLASNKVLLNIEKNIGLSAKEQLLTLYGGETFLPLQNHLILHEIFNRLISAGLKGEHEYSLTVLNSTIANAFALPGGYVFVTKGLLDLTGSDQNRIAAVLAHEIAHIEKKHGFHAMLRQMGFGLLVELGLFIFEVPPTEAIRVASQALVNVVQSGYSREAEMEADVLAQEYMLQVGFDPMGIVHMLSDFGRKESMETGGTIFQSHPKIQDRIDPVIKNAASYWTPPTLVTSRDNVILVETFGDPLGRFILISSGNEQDGKSKKTLYDSQKQATVPWFEGGLIEEVIFSPSGLLIAVVINEQNRENIYVYNRMGSLVNHWKHEQATNIGPIVFSPGEDKVAYNIATEDSKELWIGFIGETMGLNITKGDQFTVITWDENMGLLVSDSEDYYYQIAPPSIHPVVLSYPIPQVLERKPRYTPDVDWESDGNCIKIIRPEIYNF